MCGRFTLTLKAEEIKDELGLQVIPGQYQPRYNIAPTQPVAVLSEYPADQLEIMRWGLVPSWAEDVSIGNRLINARAETVATKPAFRKAFANRRCLILADGFFEWQRLDKKRGPAQPYYFKSDAEKLIAFAGLFEIWTPKEGEPLRTCTIITTSANEVVRPVHDRMPVIIPRQNWQSWIGTDNVSDLQALLQPYAAEKMRTFPVSTTVNSPAVDLPACVEPWGGE